MSRRLSLQQLLASQAPLTDICPTATGQPLWPADAVAWHMADELRNAPPASRLWRFRHRIRTTLEQVFTAVFFSACFFTVLFIVDAFSAVVYRSVSVVGKGGADPEVLQVLHQGAFSSLVLAILCAGVGYVLATRVATIRLRGPAKWECSMVNSYEQKKFPPAVQEGIVHIRAALPDATIRTYKLLQDGFVLDPVLEVSRINPLTSEEEKAYPFVWNQYGKVLSPPEPVL